MSRRRSRGRDVHGILLLDKPKGLTSNAALQRAKRLYGASKAGHTGSLDPIATGMLPLCFGAATKVSAYLLEASKTYRVTCELGVGTDTGDADGEVIERRETPPPGEAAVRAALERFRGTIEQVPPMYSALKRDGKRLYDLARAGVEVPREPRTVEISSIELLRYAWPGLEFSVTCSKGTYVRSLVVDLAAALGTVGHVTALRRVALGPFREEQMVTMEQLEAAEGAAALDAWLLPADAALEDWPRVALDRAAADRFLHGQTVPAAPGWPMRWVRVYGPGPRLLGLGEVGLDRRLAPRRLLV